MLDNHNNAAGVSTRENGKNPTCVVQSIRLWEITIVTLIHNYCFKRLIYPRHVPLGNLPPSFKPISHLNRAQLQTGKTGQKGEMSSGNEFNLQWPNRYNQNTFSRKLWSKGGPSQNYGVCPLDSSFSLNLTPLHKAIIYWPNIWIQQRQCPTRSIIN